ncbi:MAG: type II toxin-antitoxin system PemK/MazF family toxin [Cyanobacteria bacterium P01_A01_bin.123]
MAAFVKGDVVIVPFPFSDLSNAKRRPALVIASLGRQDLILCMITSQSSNDQYITAISNRDFVSGTLNRDSYVKANRVFTANERIITYIAGTLVPDKVNEVISNLITILRT